MLATLPAPGHPVHDTSAIWIPTVSSTAGRGFPRAALPTPEWIPGLHTPDGVALTSGHPDAGIDTWWRAEAGLLIVTRLAAFAVTAGLPGIAVLAGLTLTR